MSKHTEKFSDRVSAVIIGRLLGQTVTGEQIRATAEDVGVVAEHPNHWGSAIRVAINRGLLRPTGKYIATADAPSHGRKTQAYVVGCAR